MGPLARELVLTFFVSAGVVLGGSLVGSLAALVTGEPPLTALGDLAERLRMWGAVAALGGTLFTFETLEGGLFRGELVPLARQGVYLATAFLGADLASYLLARVAGTGR